MEQVAVVHCLGDCEHTSEKLEYSGIQTCKAVKTLYGGKGKCTFGCLGYGDCMSVCPNNAICIEKGIAHINTRMCVGCGLCAKTCPQGIIGIVADVERVVVSCSNKEKGALTRQECSNGCIGCKKCEKTCAHGAIKVTDNLAAIDYEACVACGDCVTACPVGCLVLSDLSGMHR